MRTSDLLTIGEVSRRSGLAVSAIRHYEGMGLIASERSGGNHRMFRRAVLRRLAAIRGGQQAGLPLDFIRESMAFLDPHEAPNRVQWRRISATWRPRLQARIEVLQAVRDNLDNCVGCGCLSMKQCALFNPQDRLSGTGSGARRLFPGT